MKGIDKGIRFTNYITDIIFVSLVWYTLVDFFEIGYLNGYGFYLILFLYYFLFELTLGQTFGKVITKTKVVKMDGSKPSFIQIILRSISRLIPIDAFSYLFGSEIGMHDVFSKTKLKKLEK